MPDSATASFITRSRCRNILFLASWLMFPLTTVAQLAGPITEAIPPSALAVRVVDWMEMPATLDPFRQSPDVFPLGVSRINFLRQLPDQRIFVNDLRGQLYVLDNTGPSVYLDFNDHPELFSRITYVGGRAAGFTSFAFHPEFDQNGHFYTIHVERRDDTSPAPDFAPPGVRVADLNFDTVITEWQANDPQDGLFDGTQRILLRVGVEPQSYFHGFGDLGFNPSAAPGDDDYGLLYISGGDHGLINGRRGEGQEPWPDQLQRLDTLAGTMIRIDPRSPQATGGRPGLGDYTVPASNPWAGDDHALGEIWAFGFRNAHRMAWDNAIDGLLVTDIGERQIEEVNLVAAGGNYGWPLFEGTFANGAAPDTAPNYSTVFPLQAIEDPDLSVGDYRFPVAQYDRNEGIAIGGGFVYGGNAIPELDGQFLFGDLVQGRLFISSTDELVTADDALPSTTSEIQEIQLFDGLGRPIDLPTLVSDRFFQRTGQQSNRVDLRFGIGVDGELYLLTKTDGMIRRLLPLLNCDLTGDGLCDVADLDLLTGQGDLQAGVTPAPPHMDFDGSLAIDIGDIHAWLQLAATRHGLNAPYVMGDTNLDGTVDFDDFSVLSTSFGRLDQVWSGGDFDGDGRVLFSDFVALANNFGTSQAETVPEPCNGVTLILVVCKLRRRRR